MAFPTTGILDDFTGDEGPPMTGWTDLLNGIKSLNGEAVGSTSAAYNWSMFNTTYGPDCESYATIVTKSAGGSGVYLRGTTQVEATFDGYECWITFSDDETQVYEFLNGVGTQIGSGDAFTAANGDKWGGEIIGTTIKVWIKDGAAAWAVNTTETDVTYANAGYTGLQIRTDDRPVDDFGGGTIAAVGMAGAMTTNTGYWGW